MSDLGSPIVNRYAERYKSFLVDSPPRNETAVTSVLRNSPLQPNRTGEHKIYEGEKYSSYEIKNEDNGEWRQLSATAEDDVKKVEVNSPRRHLQEPKTSSTTSNQYKEKSQPREKPKEQVEEKPRESYPKVKQEEHTEVRRVRKVPHYMMATTSFQKKTNPSSRDEINLGIRTKGGITKRVGTSKVPRYKSTTSINAIDDIKSEMTSEDTYVPMAARIKLFEKNLGNGANRPIPNQSISTAHSRQLKRSPSVSSRASPSSQSSQTRTSAPNYTRKTISTEEREKLTDEAMSRSSSSSSTPSRMSVRTNSDDTKV
ncbi:uncharacterized protein EV154DRAFT_496287 [Mucor mucedo]|uniref:uncharacterized protein n=1 Tax=Mucor mucedo TaxID=29922 RepID=UPI00221E4B91|nr:uncharacterized protein EV154DRAFT_496287 [Mucor mucedo]KAI7895214.1 hypothetical protein EV154DRAFT_496287 [Mucor mucedo]